MLGELRRRGEPTSFATLYQNLAKLSKTGLIGRSISLDGVVRYDANTEPHCHSVCEVCGRMVDVWYGGSPEPVFPEDASRLETWQIRGRKIEFVAVCPDCQRKP